MLLIEYVLRSGNARGRYTIENTLCGQFRDMKHFEDFTSVEAYAGRYVMSYRIIKEG